MRAAPLPGGEDASLRVTRAPPPSRQRKSPGKTCRITTEPPVEAPTGNWGRRSPQRAARQPLRPVQRRPGAAAAPVSRAPYPRAPAAPPAQEPRCASPHEGLVSRPLPRSRGERVGGPALAQVRQGRRVRAAAPNKGALEAEPQGRAGVAGRAWGPRGAGPGLTQDARAARAPGPPRPLASRPCRCSARGARCGRLSARPAELWPSPAATVLMFL